MLAIFCLFSAMFLIEKKVFNFYNRKQKMQHQIQHEVLKKKKIVKISPFWVKYFSENLETLLNIFNFVFMKKISIKLIIACEKHHLCFHFTFHDSYFSTTGKFSSVPECF